MLFVCVEVLQPSQPNGVMSSADRRCCIHVCRYLCHLLLFTSACDD